MERKLRKLVQKMVILGDLSRHKALVAEFLWVFCILA